MDTESLLKQKEDWFLFLERKQSLFLMASFIRPYNNFLVRDIGIGFQKQIHLITPDSSFYFRSRKEADVIKERLAEFILDLRNDTLLDLWFSSGLRLNAWADTQIEYFKNIQEQELKDVHRYEDFLCNFYDLLYYSTILPYWVMHAGDSILKSTSDALERDRAEVVIKKFEVLRGDTRYPQVIEGVMTQYWSYIASKTELSLQMVQLLLPDEIAEVLRSPSHAHTIENLQQRQSSVFGILPESGFFFDFSRDVLEWFLPANEVFVTEIKGHTANKGRVSGIVKIVNTIADIAKVNDGDILVSINTSPSVMPAIKKAIGIVTDEGGITCHAAIISRELKIPCVIGTKIATQVLKDGDLVEVDANNGVVRILEK